MSHRTKTFLAALAVVALGAAAWFNSFHGAFIFDDEAFTANHWIRRLWPVGPILAGPRPLVDLTFAFNYALGGLHPAGYHAVNLAIHLLAALALFGIVRRTLALPALRGRFSAETSTALAACAAVLWMVHPLQTEAVTYLVQRMESLMGLFYLLALYSLIRAASFSSHKSHASYGSYVLTVVSCALGMACKEVMVTAPVALLLYDRTFIAGSFREALRRRWGLYLALAATWLILARAILAAFSPHPVSAGFAVPGLPPLVYARSELGVILHYLRLAFWPSGLCLDYGWPIARTAARIAPGAIVVGGLLAATVWAIVRRSAWGFLGGWFFLALAPTSSFLPIQDLAFEHRMYLALAAPVTAAVIAAHLAGARLLRRLVRDEDWRKSIGFALAIALPLCAAAGLACLTARRNADYATAVSIWQDAVRKRPENPRAWNYLGAAWVEDGQPEKALDDFDRAIAIRKKAPYAEAYNNRAVAELHLGRWEPALRDLNEAVLIKPDDAPNYYNRGKALTGLNRRPEAIADYTKAITLDPFFAEAWHSRGNDYGKLGDFAAAVRDFSKAIELQPDYAAAHNDRAVARYMMKDYDQALSDLHAAQKLGWQPAPGFVEALTQAMQQRKSTQP